MSAREYESGRSGREVARLPFSDIPHQSPLFLQYQADRPSLSQYYPNSVGKISDLKGYADQVRSRVQTDRQVLCDALERINTEIDAGDITLRNIARLRESETVAVVTGQQAGLFSGPLYTVYKALTAVRIAERLTSMGTQAVPVFWAATEDHDFHEVAEAFSIGASGSIVRGEFVGSGRVREASVGSIQLDDTIVKTVETFCDSLPQTEFTAEIRLLLKQAWNPAGNFGRAFLNTLSSVLASYGIIYIDPMGQMLKSLASPIYATAIEVSDKITADVMATSDRLRKDGFSPQVNVAEDYFSLFWTDKGSRRLALRRSAGGEYRVKGGNRKFGRAELLQIARDEPEQLSPGVMLRPVVQDFLLPTVAYVGGGAEIAYFAQNSGVYGILDRPVTPIIHRQSFTIVESKHKRSFDKYGMEFRDLFDGRDANVRRVGANANPETERLFADVQARVDAEMDSLADAVTMIDPTLAANLTTRTRKIRHHVSAIREKTLAAHARSDATFIRRLDGLFAELLPRGELQERSINVFTYLNKFGPNFLDAVYDSIDADQKGHVLLEI
ncbi:MAG: bacillithiol biosynthesis cysteine-adding enzyme BshC [Pyrinomonadaceae bacterium]